MKRHSSVNNTHIDSSYRIIHGNYTATLKFDIECTEILSARLHYLADGRMHGGNSWDSSDDRGFVYINEQRRIVNHYGGTVKLNGSAYANESLGIGRHVIEIVMTNPSNRYIGRLLGRYTESDGSLLCFSGIVHEISLDGVGVSNATKFKYITGGFIANTPPASMTFDNEFNNDSTSVLTITQNAAGTWNVNDTTASKTGTGWNRLWLCNAIPWPPGLIRVSFTAQNVDATTQFHYTCYGNSNTVVYVDGDGYHEFFFPVKKEGRIFIDSEVTGLTLTNIVVEKCSHALLDCACDDSSHWHSVSLRDYVGDS